MTRLRVTMLVATCVCAVVFAAVVAGAQQAPAGAARGRGPEPPPPPQVGHGMGKLIVSGDVAQFINPDSPDNCILKNRFRKGERLGFRMTAHDGGTGEQENTATLTAHITVGGKTIDIPMRFRGAAGKDAPAPRGYLSAPYNLWVGYWVVPDDAPTGQLSYSVTAVDKFGRTGEFKPYSYANSQLSIVP